ncbi:PREDICTED: putative epidermal cell surface receptor isoform X3 [Acromyrmex echinatior]|uniref:putative epidermal cell surface receptor isoform X3 n=1 Tax=Acromyrmex echinatior TaxID=103372 RepID=UPI000581058E|nr:PREDICTED: putative epidermal cell surface receptor isoform X3 [Acromyrmex echinatior]
MRIQKRYFLLGLCLLGRVTFSLTAVNTEITTLPDNNGEGILGVQSVHTEWRNDTNDTELKSVYPTKEADIKITTEAKKKSVTDFKVKGDQKYQKSIINDDSQEVVDSNISVMSPILPTILPETKIDQSSAIIKSMNIMNITTPFLLRGVPIIAVTKTILPTSRAVQNTSKTMGIPMTEETMSSRGRDLNVTASEPMNSLHANITDLSDISMDENDKEIEGGEYIAPHNETAINISSTLFSKASICIHENRTYSVGENIVRDCEEKCICSENGIMNCQPLCIYPYVKVGRELKDYRCQEKLVAEEPCCALIFCPADLDGIVSNLEPAHTYSVRVAEGSYTSTPGPAIQVFLPAEIVKTNMSEKVTDKNTCNYRGKSYKVGAEWYDECISFCTCTEGGKSECATIECPTDFGLDLLDPNCLDWETVPANFVPKAPQCCPQEVHCRNNGSCTYEGVTYDNWTVLPSNVTGCERRCYCEMGNVSCQAACKFVPALPPAYLPCPSHQATLTHVPTNPCCTQWTCSHPSAQLSGLNVTTAYSGPLATNTFDQQTIDNIKRPNNKSEILKPSQESEHSTSFFSENSKTDKTQTDTTTHRLPHYPMDPGHPTISYNGPYSPDYLSTHLNVEDIFHLPVYSVKPMLREKSKSKFDSKKPVEVRPHKEIIDQYFSGPLVPDKFPDKATSILPYPNENQSNSLNLNKLAPSLKDHPIDQAQFIPLHSHFNTSESGFLFSSSNRENISQVNFNNQYDNTAIGLPYYDSIPVKSDLIDPNIIVPTTSKKKTTPNNPFIDAEKSKSFSILSDRLKQNKKNPDYEILPEKLHHLTNSQHPDLIQLNHTPPQDYPSVYDLHQQISGQKQLPNDQAQSVYFGTIPTTSKKTTKYHSFSQKDENGQITYHIHTPNIPNTPQQIEELLAHINQHDPNPGPFQDYSKKPAVLYNVPNNRPLPTVPLHIDAQISHSGLTHLNHPLAAQTSSQSGMDHNIIPPGFSLSGSITGFPVASPSNEVTMQILEALDEHTIRLVFTVPQVLVGLHGRVELQYTSDKTNFDPSTWKTQVFAPPNDLIATPQLEFELGDLKPMTEYKVKITVKLKDLTNSPTSKIYNVRTLEKRVEVTTLPPQIPIDAELRIAETNSTWVNVIWKKFTEYELQFIDGVQLRYKEYDSKVYAATPLIHRAVTNYVIENLKPSTTYEIGIYFIPFPGQLTELISEKTFQVTTFMEPDPYSFDVKVEVKTIKSTDVEVSWSGVPYPEDKYVNIYRAIYQSDTGKEDTSTFKIAKRDSHAKTMINDLKPGTRYRLWLEIYLTNGRIKKSNVQDFVTKPGVLLPITVAQQGKFATLPLHDGDYYGPLVVVAIVASLAILSTLILSMMLMKRRTSSKADISPRKTTSAYDNPSYKTCEDAITISNRRNKITADHEMAIISVKETT